MDERIILVDKHDNEIGSMDKMDAHLKGLLHRAFSIVIFNKKGEMMLQKRESNKYHCGGLWTNACCSHPRMGEKLEHAAHRRLKEEMGFDTELSEQFVFEYRVDFDNGLTEHEIDHVFLGYFDGTPKLNPQEAEDYKWINMEDLRADLAKHPNHYTPWFKLIVEKLK